jgi:hypothetical protein
MINNSSLISDKNLFHSNDSDFVTTNTKVLKEKVIENEVLMYITKTINDYCKNDKKKHEWCTRMWIIYYNKVKKSKKESISDCELVITFYKEAKKYDDKLLHFCFAYYKYKNYDMINIILDKLLLTYNRYSIKQLRELYFQQLIV